MTVVAAFSVKGCPLVFGDLLITEDRPSNDENVAVPAVHDLRRMLEGAGWSVSGLRQKVASISPQCVIGWSGNFYAAKQAISELRAIAATGKQMTADEIVAFLQNEPAVQKLGASFVGWAREGDGVRQFRIQSEGITEEPRLGTVFVAGSGATAVKEFVQSIRNEEIGSTGEGTASDWAASVGLMLGGMLIRSEFHDAGTDLPATLANRFGGGYELAVYAGGRFQKLSGMLFVIWQAEVSKDQTKLSFPQFLVKQEYAGDILLLRSVRLGWSADENTAHATNEQFHAVTPIYDLSDQLRREDLLKVSLQSRWLCHCVLAKLGDDVAVFTRVQRTSPDGEPMMTFDEAGEKIVIGFNGKFMDSLARSLQSGLHA